MLFQEAITKELVQKGRVAVQCTKKGEKVTRAGKMNDASE